MTTTAPSRPLSADGRGRLPAPARDRRPALAALALLLVLGGALTSALIAYRSGDRVDVLVARGDIEVGQVVTEADFAVARVAADGGAATIEAAAARNFVGTSATSRIPQGTMLNRLMFLADSNVVPSGAVVVGVVLADNQRPSEPLRAGDVVRVYLVPREAGGIVQGSVLAEAVRVVDVDQSGGDELRVSLLVPEEPSTAIVTAAATGGVALTALSPDTRPAVDFRTE